MRPLVARASNTAVAPSMIRARVRAATLTPQRRFLGWGLDFAGHRV